MHDWDGSDGYGLRKQAQIAAFYKSLGVVAPRSGYGPAIAAWFRRAKSTGSTPLQGDRAQRQAADSRQHNERETAGGYGDFASTGSTAEPPFDMTHGTDQGPLDEHVLVDAAVTPFTAPTLPPAEPPVSTGLQVAHAGGDEGGTLIQIIPPDRLPSQPSGPSWWERQKEAVVQRRARAAQRPRRSRTVRLARFSAKSVGYGLALVYGVGNLTEPLAAAWYGGGTTVADALAPAAGIMITGSGARPVFARSPGATPDEPNRAHLPEAARTSDNAAKAAFMAAALEDKRALAQPWSLAGIARVHGTDTLGLARAGLTQIAAAVGFPVKRRGGSTLPVTTCSIALGSMEMPSGLIAKVRAKLDEHLCAARLEAETRGDAQAQALMLLNNAPLTIGGGADTQGVALAAWQLFSKSFAEIDQDCHLALLAAAINKPFLVQGQSAVSQQNARSRLDALRTRTQVGLVALRQHQGREFGDDDKACLAALPGLLARRFRNPGGDLHKAFGSAAPMIAAEAFAYRAAHPGVVELTARFDAAANEAALQRVTDAACAIAARKALFLNTCPRTGAVEEAQVRVIAINTDGSVHRMVAIGAGAASALNEVETGELPGRGSVGKGILLPLLADNAFCRYNYDYMVDADGIAGFDHACRPDELTPPEFAVKHSLNQPFLYALEHANPARLARYQAALSLPQKTLRDLVLGNHPPATQILLRDYMAITSPDRIGPHPHFIIVDSANKQVDLSAVISAADAARARQLLAAPTQPGGTVHAAAVRLRAAGYTVNWAKSGTSEAGFGNQERGKHIVLELVDPTGKTLTVFAEIASADSTALAPSKLLSSADLAELILAALQGDLT